MSRKQPRTQKEIGSGVTHAARAGQEERKATLNVSALHWESERQGGGQGEREGNLEFSQEKWSFTMEVTWSYYRY